VADADPNKHIIDYLNHYCDQGSNFDYAVLLNGPWGVGKTHLIKQFIKARDELAVTKAPEDSSKPRTLFVSLYGITSVRQIEDEFQRQLHPILSSKGMKIAWAAAKGVLKAATKIDLPDNTEVTLNAQIPDIDLIEYFKTPADSLLIFDDLERCSMNVSDVLGYVNSFVEHHSFKAIILANEAAIIDRDAKYALIKEKLIGQTLEVRSSVATVLPYFVDGLRNEKTREFISKHSDILLTLHEQSKTGNLRLLQHALWDFERLSVGFNSNHWNNDVALSILLRITIALSLEVRAGLLQADDFVSLATSEIVRYMAAKRGADTSAAGKVEEKYEGMRLEETPLPFEHLRALLFEGCIDRAEVAKALDSSRYYADPALEPAWLRAWRGWDLPDDQYERAVREVEDKFSMRIFETSEEMLHIFGLRLSFSDMDAITATKEEVIDQCIDCLDILDKDDRIPEFDLSRIWRAGGMFCLGHQVSQSETPEFRKIFDAFESKVAAVKLAKLPDHGKSLLLELSKDAVLFARKIMLNSVTNSEYYNVPILATIPVSDFADALIQIAPASQGTAFAALKARYENGLLATELASEQDWLSELNTELGERLASLRPMSRFRIANLTKTNIEPFL
jgi:hypothetical protein